MPANHADDIRDFSRQTTRPEPEERLFSNTSVEETLQKTAETIHDPVLRRMFEQCYPNTLDTTVYFKNTHVPDTFVVTGDIPAMWTRDSVNQLWVYLPLAKHDAEMKKLFAGLLYRITGNINADVYANAFTREYGIWERKYELDSFSAFFRMSYGYYDTVRDTLPFTPEWINAVIRCINVMELEKLTLNKENAELLFSYRTQSGHRHPAIRLEGYGYPGKQCGLVRTVFRPSDDETVYPYNIPANFAVSRYLKAIVPILETVGAVDVARRAIHLSATIASAIDRHGTTVHPWFGKIYTYEVDGFGSSCVMDDPNIPSLLSLPYLGCVHSNDDTYQNTRKLVLSEWNSFYTNGKIACGISSAHVGVCDKFWPMATITQALTSNNPEEIISCLTLLRKTHADTYFMHESVHVDNPSHYTRHWFAWANSLFGELMLNISDTNAGILKHTFD